MDIPFELLTSIGQVDDISDLNQSRKKMMQEVSVMLYGWDLSVKHTKCHKMGNDARSLEYYSIDYVDVDNKIQNSLKNDDVISIWCGWCVVIFRGVDVPSNSKEVSGMTFYEWLRHNGCDVVIYNCMDDYASNIEGRTMSIRDILDFSIQHSNGLDCVDGNRVDLFYLTNSCNVDRLDHVKRVLSETKCATLWIGGKSNYQDYRWNDYSWLMFLPQECDKYVFYGLNYYLLLCDIFTQALRGGKPLSKLTTLSMEDVMKRIKFHGKLCLSRVRRYLLT